MYLSMRSLSSSSVRALGVCPARYCSLCTDDQTLLNSDLDFPGPFFGACASFSTIPPQKASSARRCERAGDWEEQNFFSATYFDHPGCFHRSPISATFSLEKDSLVLPWLLFQSPRCISVLPLPPSCAFFLPISVH